MRADKWLGTVTFNPTLNTFVVRYGVPGTYDSVYYGVACGLPEALRTEGQQVEFSGNYRAYTGVTQPLPPVGTEYYNLEITNASAQ